MAKEAFYFPEEHMALFCRILRAGLAVVGSDCPDDAREQILDYCDECDTYLEEVDEEGWDE